MEQEKELAIEQEDTLFRPANVISTCLLCLAVSLCLVISAQVVTRGYAGIAGYSVFRVVTGSMEPTLPVNSLVISHQTPIDSIAQGDIVVFYSPTGIVGRDRIVTHRVVSILHQDGVTALETRGDANPVADSYLIGEQRLIGKVVWYTGREREGASVVGFIGSGFGFIACIVFPLLLISGLILRGSITSIRRQLADARTAADGKGVPQEDGGAGGGRGELLQEVHGGRIAVVSETTADGCDIDQEIRVEDDVLG